MIYREQGAESAKRKKGGGGLSPDWEKIIAQAAERTRTDTTAAQNAATGSNSPCERVLQYGSIKTPMYQKPSPQPHIEAQGARARKEAFRAAFDFMERNIRRAEAQRLQSCRKSSPEDEDAFWVDVLRDAEQTASTVNGSDLGAALMAAAWEEIEREYTAARKK